MGNAKEFHSATKGKYGGTFMRGFIMLFDDVFCMSLHFPGHAALKALVRAITSLILPGY